jgi:hypothetical protein
LSIPAAAQRVEQSISDLKVLDLQSAIFRVVLSGQPATRLPVAQIQNALDPDMNVVLRSDFSTNYELESLAQEQTVRGLLVRRALEAVAHATDNDAKNELMASLTIALLALEGKQVDV